MKSGSTETDELSFSTTGRPSVYAARMPMCQTSAEPEFKYLTKDAKQSSHTCKGWASDYRYNKLNATATRAIHATYTTSLRSIILLTNSKQNSV